MNFRKINNLVGWLTGAIAFFVYLKTMEPTCSFWDCGEFISCAYKLEGGHAPGFPTLMILQRLFGLLAGPVTYTGGPSISTLGVRGAATYINSLTSVMCGLTIVMLFWTISYFAKRLVAPNTAEPEKNQTIIIIGAALVGALAYTFSDTFWFSAVEAIPFGTSPFFTAFTFWAVLKWERVADNKYADRWLVLISLVIGLAVGVHLLILLVIPPIAMVYYYRRYPNGNWIGALSAFLAGTLVLAVIQFGIIRYIPKFAAYFDLYFTNNLGANFDTGAIVFLVAVAVALIALVVIAKKKNLYALHISTMCTIFIIIGYSTYFSAVIRSRADVPVDMTNPDNPFSFVDYVAREQFGQQPIFFGPYYNSQYNAVDTSEKIYAQMKVNGKDQYVTVGKKMTPIYPDDQKHFFPRIYDGNDPAHVNYYRNFLGLGPKDDPTFADNMKYFLGYQMNWMYWRFFMWNFAGRQNDMEGQTGPQMGNWITGITFLDKMRGLGDTDKMGSGFSEDGHNKLYGLPFVLGILGIVYQFNKRKKDGVAVLTFFFFTGIAIGIFLNMPPLQPRERDYAFAGSMYVFAIWIGLGVLLVHEWVSRSLKDPIAAVGTIGLCTLAVPVLMASQEWKDHDRSGKTLPRAVAYNTLSCCDSNAVLFTFGDNQTYPLWYVQEVEGFRKDVRIINTSLLGMDWYVDQLTYRINDADAVPMVWKKDDYIGDHHNYVRYSKNPNIPENKYFNLTEICNFIDSKDPSNMASNGIESINYIPARNYFTPSLSKDELIARGWVKAEDTARVIDEMKFSFPKSAATKSDLAILNIIAAVSNDGWKRPLYFDAGLRSGDYAGTGEYMHMEGLVYHLLPFKFADAAKTNPQILGTINTDKSYDLFMHNFIWGGADGNNVYFDEPNRHDLYSYRMDATFLANSLTAEGKKDKAIEVLDKVMKGITEHSYYYDLTGYFLASSYYKAGAVEKGNALSQKMVRNAQDNIEWILSLGENGQAEMADDAKQQFQIMQGLSQTAYQAGDSVTAKAIFSKIQLLGPRARPLLNTKSPQQGGGDDEE